MSLPTDDRARKALPIFRGPLMYFPDALLEVAAVCKAGNDQHNPGEPMHWSRVKSMEQLDTALRHMMDHGMGTPRDTDGRYHMAKAAWRCLAELQLQIERDRKAAESAETKGILDDLLISTGGRTSSVEPTTTLMRTGDRVQFKRLRGVLADAPAGGGRALECWVILDGDSRPTPAMWHEIARVSEPERMPGDEYGRLPEDCK